MVSRENQGNQAGGDTAQFTHFAQTWVWGVNDWAQKKWVKIFYSLQVRVPLQKWPLVPNLIHAYYSNTDSENNQ